MVKTNAERQARYRLRQQQFGEKKRLNIWLSTYAHEELSLLAERKGMSKQLLLEWLLTNDSGWKAEAVLPEKSIVAAPGNDTEKLPCNGLRKADGNTKVVKKGSVNKLPRNEAPDVTGNKSDESIDHCSELEPSSLVSAQLELKL